VSNGGRGPAFSGEVEGLYSAGIRLKQLLYTSCSERVKHIIHLPNRLGIQTSFWNPQ